MNLLRDIAPTNPLDFGVVGAVTAVARRGELVLLQGSGFFDLQSMSPMTAASRFRLSSLAKLYTSLAGLSLISSSQLDLNASVREYVSWFDPDLHGHGRSDIKIIHLFEHSSGLSYSYEEKCNISNGLDDNDSSMAVNMMKVRDAGLAYAPGLQRDYSIATDLLGFILETICRRPLDEIITERVLAPLGVGGLALLNPDEKALCPPYHAPDSSPVQMTEPCAVQNPYGQIVVFSPSRALSKTFPVSGGAGMTATALEYITVLEAVRSRDARLFPSELYEVALADRSQMVQFSNCSSGRGFNLLSAETMRDPAAANSPMSQGSFGWIGAYGHFWFVDPANELSVVSLSNTAMVGCLGPYPETIVSRIYGAL